MASNPHQAELLALFGQTRDMLVEFIGTRSAAEQGEVGTPEQLSARDVAAQSVLWFDYMTERMAFYERHEDPPHMVDFDGLVRETFAANRERPWDEVTGRVLPALDGLVEAVKRFDDAMLEAENYYGDPADQPVGGPLRGEVRANGFIVPLEHIHAYYTRVGDKTRAAAITARLKAAGVETGRIVVDLVAPGALLAEQAAGGRLVIDVRSPKEYAAGHVKGAVNIPLGTLPKKLKTLPTDQPIVTYCNMHHPGQSRGEQAAALLRDEGFSVRAIDGGLTAWEDHGLPVEWGAPG